MGVPKLFKYLTQRYPSLSQTLTANQLPEYDYFYIDLNNLIHKALTENGSLPLEKFDDEFFAENRIFERVLRYIETLHRIIPSRVLYLAIDGVAPRAKWATQRQRRIRVAEKHDSNTSQFDSNVISPGTIFMQHFEDTLIQFISNRIECHWNWQNCDIYISGSNCPGEGSLKIVNFIRSLKQNKDSKSNETHCIYSEDNDNLLLGIATNELYISLIQERKRWPSSLSALCSDDIKHQFDVIHIEMLRQYLRMEFIDMKTEMSFEFNMDRIVDDWVLLITLIGNDYVPGLPNFRFEYDVLSMIYESYKDVLASSNGYINDSGYLHVGRFALLIESLRSKDFELFCKSWQTSSGSITAKLSHINLNNNNNDHHNDINNKNNNVGKNGMNGTNGGGPTYSDFLEMKDQYYTEKLNDTDEPNYERMSADYVKIIQWVLFYYFRGTCSWCHSYPYKCAPFISDFTTVHKTRFALNCDKPANPFTHLLAILPKSSAHLLPKSYQLMMDDNFQMGMDNLLQRSNYAEKNLNKDDKQRNEIKPVLKFRYNALKTAVDCEQIHEISTEKKMDRIDTEKHVQRPFHKNDFNFKFTTLNLHDYSSTLVESSLSKPFPRIVISLNAKQQDDDVDAVADEYLNQIVYINWPHFIEAKVIQVFNAKQKKSEFNACVDQLKTRCSEHGIELGEINVVAYVAPLKWIEYKVSEHQPIAYELLKHFDENNWQPVAIQTMVKSFMPEKNLQFQTVCDALNEDDVFLFSKNSYHFGEMGSIADSQQVATSGRVNILSYMKSVPNFEKAIEAHQAIMTNKMREFKQPCVAASILGISEKVLGKITGTVLVKPDNSTDALTKVNIGLKLKVRDVMGIILLHDYVKSSGRQFLYSQLAIDLVQQYMDKFPFIFDLISSSDAYELHISDLAQNNTNQSPMEYLAEIRNWLRTLPQFKMARTPIGVMQFSNDALKYVRDAVNATDVKDFKMLKLKMKWQNLYIPNLNNVFVIPSPEASYKLLDRIVVVRSGYPIPIGAKGTVIGIHPVRNHIVGDEITDSELSALDILMDVPYKISSDIAHFDQHFIYRTRTTNMLLNISYGRAN